MIYFIASLLTILIYFILKTRKVLLMFQQNRYNQNNWYIKWVLKNIKKVFISYDLLYLVIFLFGMFAGIKVLEILSIIIGSVLSLIIINKKEIIKKPLVVTARVKRILFTFYLLHLLCLVIIGIYFNIETIKYYYLIIGLMVYLNYITVYIASTINKPFELFINSKYKRKAIKKLNELPNMEVIGITGSYGKTSSKNILNDILNVKFVSFPTPKNFNTEAGLINTINNYLDKFNDYFIAEMGALNVTHIKTYCDLVHPKYGIITTIGTAHLETFGSQENIQKGKFDLIESLPLDGIGILNADDPLQKSFKLKNKCKIIWIGIDSKCDVRAENIKLNNDGMEFDVKLDSMVHFKTCLLGKVNIYNILAGIALGHELGLSNDELKRGVLKVKPVEHRLEIKEMGNITIIDDAYNSNPVGSKMALEVLDSMKGHKVIVTPGMVELGTRQYELNKELGVNIASVCDEVILVGEKQTKPIYDGLISAKYKENKIFVVNNINEAFALLRKNKEKNVIALLENDLPDIF